MGLRSAGIGVGRVACSKLDSCQRRRHNKEAEKGRGMYGLGRPGRIGGARSMTVLTLTVLGETAYQSLTRAALLLAAIFALTAIVIAVARRYRGRAAEDKLDRHQMMSNFRDLYDRGGLSDEEFRTIKAKLASELKAELKDNSGAG